MAEFTVYVLHRRITVRDAAPTVSSRVRTRTPPAQPDYSHKDSVAEFAVREADDHEAHVEELKRQAAVDRRVEQLRRQQR